jgi:histone H3/H4
MIGNFEEALRLGVKNAIEKRIAEVVEEVTKKATESLKEEICKAAASVALQADRVINYEFSGTDLRISIKGNFK